MKDMEASEMVTIPVSESKESPQSTMTPDPALTDKEDEATNVETKVDALATNKEVTTKLEHVVTDDKNMVEEKKELSVHNGEMVISQPNVGIKRTKGSLARDLKKMRLFKVSDEDDPDDPLPQVNNSSSSSTNPDELHKKIESIPEKTKEMEKAQTEAIMVLDEVNEILQANEDKENTYKKQTTKLKNKLRKLSRKELENMIIKQLNRKLMASEHELGKLKQLSEKLKYTLENNKKKTAQFYKEIDDLKKVTQKLMQDHEARKGQYVTPIRTQRSVGIHANEKYIQQGSMFVTNGTGPGRPGPYKIMSPSPGLSKGQLRGPDVSKNTSDASPPKGTPKTSQPITPTTSTLQTQMAQPVAASTPIQTYGAVTTPASSGSTQILRQTLMVQPPSTAASVSTRPPMVQIPRAPMVQVSRAPMVQVPMSAVTGGISSSNTNTVNSVGSSLMSIGANRISAQIVTPPQGTAFQNAHQQIVSTQTPKVAANINKAIAYTPISSARTSISGGFVDLTQENIGNQTSTIGNLHVRTPPNAVVNAPAPGIGTSVRPALIQTPGGGTQQVLLVQQLPANGSIPNTILVSNAGSTSTTGLTTSLVNPTIVNNTYSNLNNPPSVIGGFNAISVASPMGAQVAAATAVATATSQVIAPRHPAPLPPTPSHMLSAIKHSPPILTLKKVAGKENSIVLSWNMSKTDNPSSIGHYHLFSYQEGTASPTCKLWKKVGMVQALELPMACTLTQFTSGHVYHFAVRAVYSAGRVGPFSEPRSIHLG